MYLRPVNNSQFNFNYNFVHNERTRPYLLSFCHSVYLCKIGVKMLLFRCFFILCKACLQAKHHHLKIVNMPFMKHKYNTYEAQTWPLAKTVTTKKIKLPLNKEVYTQTMLMARHQKIAKLFDEDFWVTQWRSQEKDGVYVVPLDAWKIKNRRRQNFGMGHNLKTSTITKNNPLAELI